MLSDTIDIHIHVATDRRELLARFCDELARAMAGGQRWEGGGFVVPWHVSAGDFEALPAGVVAAIVEAWDEAGGQLAGIEFSGYLETDHGPRAWGSLMTRDAAPGKRPPELEACTVERAGDGYRIDARLRTTDDADG